MLMSGIIASNKLSASAATITGLELDFASSTWVGLTEVAIYDENGTNLMPGLTAVSTNVTSLGDLSDDEFGTNSEYDDNENLLNEGWPAAIGSFLPGTTTPHWSTNGTGSGIKLFVKFSAAKKISKISIIFANPQSYDLPTFTVTDQDSNTLSPFLVPNNVGDSIWGEDALFGTTSVKKYGYSWYYPDYTEIETIEDFVGVAPLIYIDPNNGDLTNQGSGGSAYDMSLGSLSITANDDADYVQADGTNFLELSGALSSATFLDNLKRTDADRDYSFAMIANIASVTGSGQANMPQFFGTGTDQGLYPQEVHWLAQMWDATQKRVAHVQSDDAQLHAMHKDDANTKVPIGSDFYFSYAGQLLDPDTVTSNNPYRGTITDDVAAGDGYKQNQKVSEQRLNHDPLGSDALCSDSTNPGFWIMGAEDRLGNSQSVWENGSKFYAFLAFDAYLTIEQQLKLHQWLQRKQRRNIGL